MHPEYLMKSVRCKGGTLLDQGKWEALDYQQAHMITLQIEINNFKIKNKDAAMNPNHSKGEK